MIHYHGTPITPMRELLAMTGRHYCVSFAAPHDKMRCLSIGQSVMFDNGAFSAFTRGAELDVLGYYQWIEESLGHPHWAVIPDRIGGCEDEQRALLATWPYPKEFGAPVWHLHLSLDYLLELVDSWPRVCLGSSGQFWQVRSPAWCGRMDEVFNTMAKRSRFMPNLHGLRMLSLGGAEWPLSSADSTNVAQNFKTTGITAEAAAARIDVAQTPVRWKPREIQQEMNYADMA